MTVITAIFEAIASFFEAIYAIILLILLSVILIINGIYNALRPRYKITDDFLADQGIVDVEFIDSDYKVTADYERTYSGVTHEEYEDYCQYLFDYLNSKEYQVCRYNGEGSNFIIFPMYTNYYTDCDDVDSLFSDDRSSFEIYYLYNDNIEGIIVSYKDESLVVHIYQNESTLIFFVFDEYVPATDEDADVPIVGEPVPVG